MVRELVSWLPFVSGADGDAADDGTDETADDESGFLPSRLDASVLFAHGRGSGTQEVASESDDLEAAAREAERKRHDG